MSRRRSRPTDSPALLESDQETIATMLPDVRRVQTLQKAYAGPIIADGLFNSSGGLSWGILASLAKEDAREDKAALDALFERLRSAGIDTRIHRRKPRVGGESDFAIDLCNSYASTWGDVGFMLGIAVGMQLGPNALKSGVL